MPLSKFDFNHTELAQLAIFREITRFYADKFQPYALIWAYALIYYFKIVLPMPLFKTMPLFGSLEYLDMEILHTYEYFLLDKLHFELHTYVHICIQSCKNQKFLGCRDPR